VFRFLLLILAIILYGSFEPWAFNFAKPGNPLSALLRSWPAMGIPAMGDALVNIVMYFPFGALVWGIAARRCSRNSSLILAAALSFIASGAVEFLQFYDRGRVGSLFDVATNVLGGFAGAAAAILFLSKWEHWRPARLSRAEAASFVLLLVGWAGYEAYPMHPLFDAHMLHNGLAHVLHPPAISAAAILRNAAEWMAAAVLVETVAGRMRVLWMLVALAYLPLRLIMPTPGLDAEQLLGPALAMLLYAAAGRLEFRARTLAAAGLLLAALAVDNLAPLRFSSAAQPFAWDPFLNLTGRDWAPATMALWREAYDFGAAVAILRLGGMSSSAASVALVAGLSLCQAARIWMPENPPDLTELAMALLTGLTLAWLAGEIGQAHRPIAKPPPSD